MKVLFVTRPFITEPLGILYLSSVAKDASHQVEMCLTSDDVHAKVENYKPDLICYSLMTGNQNFYIKFNNELKKNNDFIAVFGGSHPTFFPDLIQNDGVDIICRGEGEAAFLELLTYLRDGKNITSIMNMDVNIESLKKTSMGAANLSAKAAPKMGCPAVQQKMASLFSTNDVRPFLEIDDIPMPDRDLIAFKTNLPIKHFIATRGCPYDCSYCFNKKYYDLYSEKSKRIRIRNHELLVDEIASVVFNDNNPTNLVYFLDDVFALDKNWLVDFGKEYQKRIGLPFHCHVRPNSLTPDRAAALRAAGCNSVSMALESANDRLRNQILNRNLPKSKIIESVKLLQKNGIKLKLQSMIGLPTGGIAEDLETLEMNIALQPDYAWVSILQPYPGTQLGEFCVSEGWYKGDFSDLESNFFDTSLLEFDDEYKSKVANLQKIFAFTVKNHKIYKTPQFWRIINGKRTPKLTSYLENLYTTFRKSAEEGMYGFEIEAKYKFDNEEIKKAPDRIKKAPIPIWAPGG
jgi:anaerobic magnesium-protoporphyrin IX monomethyl ester cyclase